MGNMMTAFLYAGVLGAIFAIVYTMNRMTPVPEGCEDLKVDCQGCRDIACGNHPSHNE